MTTPLRKMPPSSGLLFSDRDPNNPVCYAKMDMPWAEYTTSQPDKSIAADVRPINPALYTIPYHRPIPGATVTAYETGKILLTLTSSEYRDTLTFIANKSAKYNAKTSGWIMTFAQFAKFIHAKNNNSTFLPAVMAAIESIAQPAPQAIDPQPAAVIGPEPAAQPVPVCTRCINYRCQLRGTVEACNDFITSQDENGPRKKIKTPQVKTPAYKPVTKPADKPAETVEHTPAQVYADRLATPKTIKPAAAQNTDYETSMAAIMRKYAYLDKMNPMYKASINNGRVNLKNEIAALDAEYIPLDVTAEFTKISTTA